MPDSRAKMHGLKCTKNRFRLGLRPRPRWGSLERSPDPLAGFKGSTSKGKEGRGRRGGEGKGREEGRGREGRGGKGKEGGRGNGNTNAIPNFFRPWGGGEGEGMGEG